jgi:hypothetical protein
MKWIIEECRKFNNRERHDLYSAHNVFFDTLTTVTALNNFVGLLLQTFLQINVLIIVLLCK